MDLILSYVMQFLGYAAIIFARLSLFFTIVLTALFFAFVAGTAWFWTWTALEGIRP